MSFLLEGYRQDLNIEESSVREFYEEYISLNKAFGSKEGNYDDILLGYGTEELKFTLGFLTNIMENIQKKGYQVIDSIFDSVEHSGEFGLSVFFGNRIMERFSSPNSNDFLIRIYTLKRVLNALLILDDRINYIKYLMEFICQIKDFYSMYPALQKENYKNSIDFYQFMYIYALKIHGDEEKALGYLIKGYNLKKFMIDEGILPYPEENNIFQIINIVGSYLQLEDSFLSLILDIDKYIKEFVKQIKDLKNYSLKKPSVLTPYTQNPFKSYINQFLTNIYILGFEEEYKQVSEFLPDILSKEHRLIIRINEIFLKEELKEEKLKQIREDIQLAFNNLSTEKKISVLYVFYNAYISVFKENLAEIQKLKEEIEKNMKKMKNPLSLNVPYFRVLSILGEKEKAKKIAEETKQQAVISGKKFLAKAVDDYIELEL
ncbi:hypothetical protein SAMN06265182_0168 [Persephonella hydrogeniphila]|uniref:Uncharacterized protein n=1 Tax=Persephonella hydrogeniphila TaxID=198703 RepID=A0A285MZK4_9AQUI|nr:hypothetical protein [Persephonella hydrogeniphila]SNZ02629.1 hypothetical protein SAMN06265182_0168 [Persephonella hydrogeniphila]